METPTNKTYDAVSKALRFIDQASFDKDARGAFHAFFGYVVGSLEGDGVIDQYEAAALNNSFSASRQRWYDLPVNSLSDEA